MGLEEREIGLTSAQWGDLLESSANKIASANATGKLMDLRLCSSFLREKKVYFAQPSTSSAQ